jgi:ketosteroid isomerase-like protein
VADNQDPAAATVIRDMLQSWATSVRLRDIDGVVADHDDHIRYFDVPPPVELRGIDTYRASWSDQLFPFLGRSGRFDLAELEIEAGDDVAFAHGIIRCQGAEQPDAFTVRLSVGLRKIDGRWTVLHEHHSEPSTT